MALVKTVAYSTPIRPSTKKASTQTGSAAPGSENHSSAEPSA